MAAATLASGCAPPAAPPTNERQLAEAIQGCWRTTVGAFKIDEHTAVDSGQTILPPIVDFDTVPGLTFWNTNEGRRVRGIPLRSGSRYQDGLYTVAMPDSVHVTWSNGVVGVSLRLRWERNSMTGIASAFTDYDGSESAPIQLKRAVCPRHTSSGT